jgi:ribosomal protein L11 methyltransferase
MIMEKQINWYAVEISIPAGKEEAVEFALNELDSLGNEINNLGQKAAENLTVIGYFNELPTADVLQNKLAEALQIYGFSSDEIIKVETKEIEDQDWLAEWKKHWKPTETGKFIISPPWETPASDEKIVIKIEPNMAFGTGTHETTRLCLRAIEKYYEDGMSFFDVGTGTGILSIAVAKLRGESSEFGGESSEVRVVACDTDVDSVKIAKENALLNETPEIDFYIGSISADSPEFDFVCANVTADIIIPMLPLLVPKSKQILLLSGILVEQEGLVLTELEKLGINKTNIETDGEWISIVTEITQNT